MRAWRRGAALFALIVCVLPAIPPAHADFFLVMPYTCEMSGGRPRLTPGPERGYRIIGEREQRRFNACSPANPGMCRRWTVYRFDLDCNGVRVPWVEVVAAANDSGRRARLVDGSLELRMPPPWSLPQDDPCASDSGEEGPFSDRPRQRRCAERLARAPPAVVEMPRGFAPMLGIDAIFVRAAPDTAKAPPPEPPPAVEAGAEQSQPIPRADPPPSKPAGGATAKRTPPATPPPPPPPQGLQEANSKAKPPAPAEPPPAKEMIAPAKEVAAPSPPPKSPAPKSPPPSNSPPPPKGATAPPPPTKAAAAPKEVAAPPPEGPSPPDANPAAKVAAAPPGPKREAPPLPPPPARTPEQEDKAAQSWLFSFSTLRTPTMGVIVAFTGLTLGLLIAFAAARRRERLQHAAGTRGRASGLPQLGFDDGSAPPGEAASPLSRVPGASAADAALAAWGERVLRTRKEAFELLAAGARRGTDAAAIKKVVDALRRHWHPDLAQDEADRQVRELRSKQINAAWDLLQGERADA